MTNKKIIIILSIIAFLLVVYKAQAGLLEDIQAWFTSIQQAEEPIVVLGAPASRRERNILPAADLTYELGTTTPALEWLNIFTQNITVSGTCTGCGATDPDVILTVSGGTTYLQASTTANAWLFPTGFLSTASSTVDGLLMITGTTTVTAHITIGTSTPHQKSALNIEIDEPEEHGIKITGHRTQDEHIFSIENATGTELFTIGNDGNVTIDNSAEEAGVDALHIDNDINTRADVSSIAISQILTGLAAEESGTGISVTINTADSAVNSIYDAFNCLSLGQGSAELTCIAVGSGLSPIHQNSGTAGIADAVLLASSSFSTFLDITTAAGSTGTDVEMFALDGEFLIIRSTGQFEEIKVDLDTEASKKIFQNVRTWEHSASGDSWVGFEPASTINGFEESGVVSMELDIIGDDWVVSTVNGVGSLFSIRVQRTRNNINTVPIENIIEIAATTTFAWDPNGVLTVSSVFASSTVIFDGLSTFGGGFIATASSTVNSNFNITGSLSASSTAAFGGVAFFDSGINVSGDTITDFSGDGTISFVSGTLRVIDLNCTNCIGETEISDVYLVNNANDTTSGILTVAGIDMDTTGNRIDFDTDNDTSIRASGDDEFSFEQLGVDRTIWGLTNYRFNDTTLNMDFIIDGDNIADLFFLNAGTDRIGIATTAPNALLAIDGGSAYVKEVILADGSTIDVDFADSNQSVVTLGDNRTITFSNFRQGMTHRFILCQDGTGSRTVDWPASTTLKWIDQTTPTLTTEAGRCDVISFLVTNATSTSVVFGILNSDF